MEDRKFDRKGIATHGKAVFYAAIYGDLREKALECGWALGLHGSLNSDMDIMAMPWTEKATDADVMIDKLMECFCNKDGDVLFHQKKHINEKPNGRIVYTIPIWADFYIDLNIINYNGKFI